MKYIDNDLLLLIGLYFWWFGMGFDKETERRKYKEEGSKIQAGLYPVPALIYFKKYWSWMVKMSLEYAVCFKEWSGTVLCKNNNWNINKTSQTLKKKKVIFRVNTCFPCTFSVGTLFSLSLCNASPGYIEGTQKQKLVLGARRRALRARLLHAGSNFCEAADGERGGWW